MIAYQKRQLPSDDVGEPGDLPLELQGLADISLADLIWTDVALGYHGFGYFPVEVDDPPPPVPYTLTRWQYTMSLRHFNALETVFTAADALPATDPTRLYFRETDIFDRRHDSYVAMATGLGAAEEDTELVFAYGGTLAP